ncbi:hypothetical protein FRX31_020932, partial [Thalictrum thalictroides]
LDLTRFFNRFSNIDMAYDVMDSETVSAGEDVTLHFTLEWDLGGISDVGPVDALGILKPKDDGL